MATLTQMKRGLSLRPTYDQVLNSYLSGGHDIKKPNRIASFVRASPQYQDLLKDDFVDLQKQQNDMLKSQKRDVLLKEQSSQSGSDMKPIIASESPAESVASQQQLSDLSALSKHDTELQFEYEDYDAFLSELEEDKEYKVKVRGKQLIKERLREVKEQSEYLGGLHDLFSAAKATGTEDYSGALGHKGLEKDLAKRQQSGEVRVLPASTKNPPPYITELSTDPKARAAAKEYFGLFDPQSQEASSPSASPVKFDIGTPRPDRSKTRSRARSTTGTKGETNDPETNVAKSRGRPPGSTNKPK